MSFFLLCCQFARNQMLNLGSKPYTGVRVEHTDRERVHYWDRLSQGFLGTILAKVFFSPFFASDRERVWIRGEVLQRYSQTCFIVPLPLPTPSPTLNP